MKRAAASPPTTAIAGARSRISRLPVAWLRRCSSSPMFSPWAASPKTSIGPAPLEHAREPRAEVVAEEAQPLDRLVVADAEPQRPAGTLVQRRERAPPRRPPRPRPASTASRRPSSARRGRARCPARARSRRAPAGPPPRTRARPALEQHRGHERAPLRVAHPLPRDRRPRVQQHALAKPGDHRGRRRNRHRQRRAAPRSSPRPTRWPPRPSGRAGPTAGSARRARPGPRPPAGASRPRPPARPDRAERRRTSPAPGSPPRHGAGRRLEGSCAPPRCLNDRDGGSGRAGGARHDGTGSARQARPRPRHAPGRRARRRRRRARPPRGRVHRHLRRGDLAAVPARRPVRRGLGRGRHQRLGHPGDGGAAAGHRRHAGLAEQGHTPKRSWTASAGRPSGSACRSSAGI